MLKFEDLKTEIEKELSPVEEASSEETSKEETLEEEKPKEEKPVEEDPEYDLKGRKTKLSQILEWEKGYMRDADYRRKTQKLAEERKRLEWLDALDNYLRANPHLAEKVHRILTERELPESQTSEEVLEDEYAKSIVQAIEKKFGARLDRIEQALLARMEEEEVSDLEAQIEEEIQELSSRYKFASDKERLLFERTVLQAMLANPDMEAEDLAEEAYKEISEIRSGIIEKGEIPDELRKRIIEEYRESKKSPPIQSKKGEIVTPGPEKLRFDDGSLEKAVKEALQKSLE